MITHVAAGAVQSGSTDAINGGQFAEVISVFGKLGFDVLGAEKADTGTDGFKMTTFNAVLLEKLLMKALRLLTRA
ncbi:hypothetical protein JFL59_04175 [Histophilus somni]|uniref:hypothetical protein n=1 Tax=Histophilus somni TaxID=731 RepID=UPI0018EBC269|nr:hypothetical protein [Histophilus somni]QQF71195.1 hypothetical protein JFL59_04175 [Histophilus somni]